jgi:hypothetical protein
MLEVAVDDQTHFTRERTSPLVECKGSPIMLKGGEAHVGGAIP